MMNNNFPSSHPTTTTTTTSTASAIQHQPQFFTSPMMNNMFQATEAFMNMQQQQPPAATLSSTTTAFVVPTNVPHSVSVEPTPMNPSTPVQIGDVSSKELDLQGKVNIRKYCLFCFYRFHLQDSDTFFISFHSFIHSFSHPHRYF